MDHKALVEAVHEKFIRNPSDHIGWLTGAVWILTILFIYAHAAIGYTHGSLIGALAMVEDTSPTAIIRSTSENKDQPPAYTDDPDAPPPAYAREEVLLLTPTPITASNRGTVRHLKQIGGRGARFRGLGISVIYTFIVYYLCWGIFLVTGAHSLVGLSLSFVLAQLVLFRVNMLWTHVVISAPSDTRMRERFVPWAQAKKVLLPTLGWALAHIAIPALLMAEITALDMEPLVGKLLGTAIGKREAVRLAGSALLVLATAGLLMLLVFVPANVALTRCQAALLDARATPIVPLDRTFAGSLRADAPRLRLRAAWASFDWNARMRLAKVYLKTAAFQFLSVLAYLASVLVLCTVWVLLM